VSGGVPRTVKQEDVLVWPGGTPSTDVDVWFIHAFADSHRSFQRVFAAPLAARVRLFLFDLPGHGASRSRAAGLTVEEAARVSRDLIAAHSRSRRVVLVAHSMASIVATRTALLLERSPALVISVEGNLTPADAYYTGQAAGFDDPNRFQAYFYETILGLAEKDEVMRRYSENVRRADPNTIWTLGRSVLGYRTPGLDYLRLDCPSCYYWDPSSVTADSRRFLAAHDMRCRTFPGCGHWPMVTSPPTFYAALEQDILGIM
jgi:pimeloyl-ACP methyl ester carboxylesterase